MSELVVDEVGLWIAQWPDGLIGVNANHQIIYLSKAAHTLGGWSLDNLYLKHPHDVLCSRTRGYSHEIQDCPICHFLPSAHPKVISTFWKGGGGENVSVDYRVISIGSGSKVAYFLSFQNNLVVEHSQNEMERFSEYVDKNPEPIAEFDSEGQMIFANSELQNQLLEKGFNDYGEPMIFPVNLADLCNRCIENQQVIANVEVEVADSWFRWHLSPIDINGGHSVMGYGFDVTQEKKLEHEHETRKAEARRDFFAKMVHELRTPLNAIIGFSQVLIRRTESLLPEKEYSLLKSIYMAGLQLNEMISDTLDISKIDAGKMSLDPESFQIVSLFESFQDQVESLAHAKRLSYLLICDEHLEIYSDPKKVRQVFLNLISNAIKYTREGGIEVKVLASYCPKLGDGLQIDFVDSGIGIPQSDIDSLFDAYHQVDDVNNRGVQGTGLGLTLVAELVEMLKGRISVASIQGEGSTFSVFLPLSL